MAAPQKLFAVVRWLPWCGSAAAVSLDQITKLFAETAHLISPPVPTMAFHRASSSTVLLLETESFDAFVSLDTTHVANAGVTLGLLEDSPAPVPWIAFMITSAIGLGAVALVLVRAREREWAMRFGALLVGAGIVGNLVDRVRLGYVIDWVYVRWRVFGWAYDVPTFNLADIFIAGGSAVAVAALIWSRITNREGTRTQETRA
ncbi:MAG: signal peptidase II [Polyangiaceae bacterium]|nr:signal peptidase II [Polyangiaceae bacterium]